MPNASFVQNSFLGGEWSPAAQGRTDEVPYKTALGTSLNGYARVNGSWTRRQGFMYMAHTRWGNPGRLIGLEFSFSDAYQLELTDGYIRFYKGNAQVYTSDGGVVVASISTANPAVVTVVGKVPSAWANGDTVTPDMLPPMSAPVLGSRQYTIGALTTTTFALYDALTGAGVDGSTFTYTAPTNGNIDRFYKILEFTTPYSNGAWQNIRVIKTDTSAVALHSLFQPQAIALSAGTWSVGAQSFSDGPYLDPNTTTTTLTPSGTSGSVTLTASSTTGINGNAGFVQTDIGRMVRLMTAPAAWASGTTYAKDAVVLGSDTNIYTSVSGGNVGNNPTSDSGINWALSGQSVVWSWLSITAWTDSEHVTATVEGDTLYSTAAVTTWQLGYFSDTTGWPTNGVYHEGRLWLGGGAISNRYDGSVAGDVFNFSPTASDGTVADNNGIPAILNAPEANVGLWMLTTPQGILVGTRAGEWLIAASALNDPITPTSIQAHRVSTYGCADIEPIFASLTTVFVQRQQRKIMDYAQYPYGEAAGWYAEDLTLLADHITNGGIEEIRWQEEPNRMIWGRRADGTLVSSTFQHAPYGRTSFNAWARHSLGGNRTVYSLSSGPTFDGLSTTIYAVVYDPTGGHYHAVALSPVFDDSVADWAATFVDGTATPAGSQVKDTTIGDSYSGLQLNGLYNLAGQSVDVAVGGMDLGTFTVSASGAVDMPYTSTFTSSFLSGLDNGTDYSVYQIEAAQPAYHTYSNEAIGAYTNNGSTISGNSFAIDVARNWFLYLDTGKIVRCNLETMAWEATLTAAEAFAGNPAGYAFDSNGFCYHPANGKIYTQQPGNSVPLWVIDVASMTLSGVFGTFNSGLGTTGPTNITCGFNTSIPLSFDGGNYYIHTGIKSAGNNNEISIFEADSLKFCAKKVFSDVQVWLGLGPAETGTFYAIGTPSLSGSGTTVGVNIYACSAAAISTFSALTAPVFTATLLGAITPANIDSTWTHIQSVFGPGFDPTDGNILAYFETGDSVTNTRYWVKINSSSGAIVWKAADTTWPAGTSSLVFADLSSGFYNYVNESGSATGYELQFNSLDLATGVVTTSLSSANLSNFVNSNRQLPFGAKNAVIASAAWTSSGHTPVFLTSGASAGGSQWYLVTQKGPASSANWPPPDVYKIPGSVGLTYTSQGQLLRPDQGQEAGAADGPAFSKLRRVHKYGVSVYRSQNFSLGTDFVTMDPLTVLDETETPILQPSLFTGILRGTLENDYSTEGQVAWQVTRPTPLTITSIGGFIATQDE